MSDEPKWGSIDHVRTYKLVKSSSRRKCGCCGKRATHLGLGNGVVLDMGCEWFVRMWCRDPLAAYSMLPRSRAGRT